MKQRGRKSGSSLQVVVPIGTRPRLEPPATLTPEQREVWLATVNSKPSDWFDAAHVPLLASYCAHVCSAAVIQSMVDKIKPTPHMETDKLRRYQRLLTMHDRESRAAASLATKMRLTVQSQMHPRTA